MRPDNKKGYLIVFEGIDGTGKSTQLQLLADFLKNKGYSVIKTREPTDGQYGRQIRDLYLNRKQVSLAEELELFLADRREHVDKILNPELTRGTVILCDRYYLSTAAYQGAAGLSPSDIFDKNSFAPVPDLALLFTAPTRIGIDRITTGRGETLNDFEQESSLEKVAEIFNSMDFPYIQRIEASGSISDIHSSVRQAVLTLLE